jgi:hypothetical protein
MAHSFLEHAFPRSDSLIPCSNNHFSYWNKRIPLPDRHFPCAESETYFADYYPGAENECPGWENECPGAENGHPGAENHCPGWENELPGSKRHSSGVDWLFAF